MTLETAREVARLSKTDMAKALGVSPRTVFNWEHGLTPVTRLVVLGYSAVTGVPEADITAVTGGSLQRPSPTGASPPLVGATYALAA